jgi:ABC-type protease/lipase transport system fused ATPase/permease subunit
MATATDMLDAPLLAALMLMVVFIIHPAFFILTIVVGAIAIASLIAINEENRARVAARARAFEEAQALGARAAALRP